MLCLILDGINFDKIFCILTRVMFIPSPLLSLREMPSRGVHTAFLSGPGILVRCIVVILVFRCC